MLPIAWFINAIEKSNEFTRPSQFEMTCSSYCFCDILNEADIKFLME